MEHINWTPVVQVITIIAALGTLALSISIAIFKGFKIIISQVQLMINSMEGRLTVRIDRLESRMSEVEKDVSMVKGMLTTNRKPKGEK
jgi:hypothetical protein